MRFKNFNFEQNLKKSRLTSGLILSFLFSTAVQAQSSEAKSLSLQPKSFLVAQAEDELFENFDSDSSLDDPIEVNSSTSSDPNLESYLSEDPSFTPPPILGETAEETYDDVEPIQEPTPRSTNDGLNDKAIANDIKSMKGPNKKTDTRRVKFIKHPNQKHGLYKITSDGRYYYKIDETKQKFGLGLKVGAVNLNQLENIVGNRLVRFNDVYGTSAKGSFYAEYYWSYFKNKNVHQLLKKARVKLGSGLLLASGQGQFSNPNYLGVPSSEPYTFLAFPNHLGLHLAFEFKPNQLIVPFVTGALEYLVGFEIATDNFSRSKMLGQLGAHMGGGLALSLGWLDEVAKINLDTEYGINQSFLTVEFRQNVAIQSDFDFTATFLTVGLQLEY